MRKKICPPPRTRTNDKALRATLPVLKVLEKAFLNNKDDIFEFFPARLSGPKRVKTDKKMILEDADRGTVWGTSPQSS